MAATTETRDPELAEAEQTEQTYPTPAPQPVVASAPVPPPPSAAPVPFHPTGPGTGWSGSAAYVSRPPSGSTTDPFANPQYQKQIEQQQLEIYRHAKNVAQAEKDVASARRMLGILSADRMIAGGATPEQAIFKNLHLLTTPGGADYARGLTSHRLNLPVPKPYGMSITAGGNQIPLVVTPGVGGSQQTHVIRASDLPKPPVVPGVQELEPGLRVATLGPGQHIIKKEAPEKMSEMDKMSVHQLNTELGQIRKKKADEIARSSSWLSAVGGPGGPRKEVLKELKEREAEIVAELKQYQPDSAKARKRLKWNTQKKDFEAASAEEE